MRSSLKAILAGSVVAGAMALAVGAATPAVARDDDSHVLLVQLPGGAMEQIEYTGRVAPRLVLAPSPFAIDPTFAAFNRMAALMDRQAAGMLHQVAEMPGWNGALPALPPGVSGYSSVTTISDGRACTHTTEIRYDGRGMQPQTVSDVSGDCGAVTSPQRSVPVEQPASVGPTARLRTIRVKATLPSARRPLLQEAFYQH